MVPNFLRGMQFLTPDEFAKQRILVIIQFSGGNDGLNTVVPYGDDLYYTHRPKLAIPESKVLSLDEHMGLNPNMKGCRDLFDNGEMSIINNVGYPNPNRSHFRSMDIWHSASDSDEFVTTGWIGRYMDSNCKLPHEVLEINDSLQLSAVGENMSGISMSDAKSLMDYTGSKFYQALVDKSSDAMLSDDNLGYLYKTAIQARSSADYVFDNTKHYETEVAYGNTPFSKKMKTIASCINSGLSTKVYYVTLGGFDTHANQGHRHEKLLKDYDESVTAFVKDLKRSGSFDNTAILTFSEFGRRVKENKSYGTDHGTANNVFVMGRHLKKAGFYNEYPDLEHLDNNKDLKFSVDFRRIYASLLDEWLGANSKSILGKSFDGLGLF